jgi:hypothetical protein
MARAMHCASSEQKATMQVGSARWNGYSEQRSLATAGLGVSGFASDGYHAAWIRRVFWAGQGGN